MSDFDAATEVREDDPLEARRVDAVLAAVEGGDAARLTALLEPLHAADIADLLEQIGPNDRRDLLRLWSGEIDGEILSEIDESIRDEVIEYLSPEVLAEAVRELDSDDLVDILEDLEEPQQEAILGALDVTDRLAVRQAMAFPEESAGRLMQREVVMAPEHWTVGEAIDYLRGAEHLPDQFYHVILVDPRMKPQGYVTLGRLLSSRREVRLREITEESFRTIAVTDAEGDVAYIFNQYHLISCPVVDAEGRLAGVGDEASLSDGPFATVRQRLPWLVINLFTASLSAMVITQFQATIAQLVVLAALMPIVASTGGIAGTQSLAVAVRALATRDLTRANARRVVVREVIAGFLNGLGLALILGLAGALIFGDPALGAVLAGAMIVNQVVAALGGVLVPLTLERMGLDPALASGTFVTTMTDVTGFFVFLGLATLVLV